MNVETINPFELPSLPLNNYLQLPSYQAIYFVFSEDEIAYIGKTKNLTQRLKAHNRRKQFTKMGDKTRIAWLECSDMQLLGQIETALINYFKPRLNGTNNPDASKRINTILSSEVYELIKNLAGTERRSQSQTAAILIEEALEARNLLKKSPSPDKSKGAA